jgi:hypothetical protein
MIRCSLLGFTSHESVELAAAAARMVGGGKEACR